MPTIVPCYSLCDHGEFEVMPFKEGGCNQCKEEGMKRFHAVKNGNYKFVTFGKRKASSNPKDTYSGDIVWWFHPSDHDQSKKKKRKIIDDNEKVEVIDRNVKLFDEHKLNDVIEVTERHSKPHFYSSSLNEFWSMVYHHGSVEECLKKVEENEWESDDEEQNAFREYFSEMMGDLDDDDEYYDDDDEYYDEDEDDEYYDDMYYDDDDDDDEVDFGYTQQRTTTQNIKPPSEAERKKAEQELFATLEKEEQKKKSQQGNSKKNKKTQKKTQQPTRSAQSSKKVPKHTEEKEEEQCEECDTTYSDKNNSFSFLSDNPEVKPKQNKKKK